MRGMHGKKCPIGHLIDDRYFLSWMERKNARNLFLDLRFPNFLRIRYMPYLNIINDVSLAHDDACNSLIIDDKIWYACFIKKAKSIL